MRLGVTNGDPAGIGPEVIEAALASGKLPEGVEIRRFGEAASMPGRPTVDGAQNAFAALEEAIGAFRHGEIDGIVTGPIHKKTMYEAGFHWPGHTEYFADRFGITDFAMLLTGGQLSVGLVTIHEPLARVSGMIRSSEVVRVGALMLDFLKLRLARPVRLAVAGLNPHAGESGTMGREEIEEIEPAVRELRSRYGGETIEGPLPPDTIFFHALEGAWDGVLCMYHDQGLIPLKMHAFHEGVNVTLGLPVVRTSPDHGTAFALAGKGLARPDSMISAIRLAAELVEKRRVVNR